jgi:hypothetical protein
MISRTEVRELLARAEAKELTSADFERLVLSDREFLTFHSESMIATFPPEAQEWVREQGKETLRLLHEHFLQKLKQNPVQAIESFSAKLDMFEPLILLKEYQTPL